MSAAQAAGHDPGVHPPAPPETAVTVCTVSFHNAPHLRLNWALADALNREEAQIDWVVAENTPPYSDDRLDPGDQRFKVIEGVGPEHSPNFQHTLALHKCFDFVTTRFLLVLDPDFYIVRPNWVRTVTEHMQRHALTFLGVPWHPRFSDKFRYFPAVHCFFVDLDRIDIKELDFRPMRSDFSRDTKRGSELMVDPEAWPRCAPQGLHRHRHAPLSPLRPQHGGALRMRPAGFPPSG